MKPQTPYRKRLIALGVSIMTLTMQVDAAELKQSIKVASDTVKLSDLFTDVSKEQDKTVMASPAPGASKQISAYELMGVAKKNGISWERPAFLKTVKVARSGFAVSHDTLLRLVENTARDYGIYDDVRVRLFGNHNKFFVASQSDIASLSFSEFSLNERKDRFTATLENPFDGSITRLTGNIDRVRTIPVLAHAIAPGDVITDADIAWEAISTRRIGRNTVQTVDELVGNTLRRPVQVGRMLRTSDVMRPVMIKRGSAVTVSLSNSTMQLASTGKALENGSKGDLIRVMNLMSKKTIEAQVTGPNQVTIVTASPIRLAAR